MTLASDSTLITGETGAQRLINYIVDVGHQDKRARCRLTITTDHLNRHGALHGGITSCLLDSAAGATASLSVDDTGRAPFLSISLTVNYLSPAIAGTVEAVGTITGGGRKLLFVAAELKDESGNVLANSTGVYKRVPPERL